MINHTAKWISRHSKLIAIICILLIIPSIIGYLSTFINYDILSYLPKNLNSVAGEEILDKTFGNSATAFIIIKNQPAGTTQRLKNKISKIEGVSQVLWIDDIADISIPREILPDEIQRIFYSKDGSTTLMMVQFSGSASSDSTTAAIKQIRKYMNKDMLISGLSAIGYDTKKLADSQSFIFIMLAISIALVIISFTLESYALPFILLASLMLAVIYNMGTNIIFGSISYITQCISAILQLGVTMDYSVFLIDRYTEEKRFFDNKQDAMAKAISGTFVSLIGSSLTTIFGFLALCFMSLTLGKDIGLVMAKGVIFGVLSVVTFLPSLVLLLDDKIENTRHNSKIPNFDRLNRFTIKHRRLFAIILLILIIPSYLASSKLNLYYDMTKSLPQNLISVRGLNEMKEKFNMASTHFVIINKDIPSNKLESMTTEIKKIDGINSVLSLSSFIGAAVPKEILPEKFTKISESKNYQLIMITSEYNTASDEVNAQIDKIKDIVFKYDKNGYITGEGVMTKDLIDITKRDFAITNILSIAAIFILIAITFKSISIPFILVSAIELAIFINESISFIINEPLPFIAPTIISAVQLGATVDYAILLTSRFREERRFGKTDKEAIIAAANAADRSIFQSALVFFGATFGVYLSCNIQIVKSICGLLARGALISGIVIIVFLTPILFISEKFIDKTTLQWTYSSTLTKKIHKHIKNKFNDKIKKG